MTGVGSRRRDPAARAFGDELMLRASTERTVQRSNV